MFTNYIKIAFRNLKRNRAFSLINIFGLVLGTASCLVLFLVVRNELSYDNFHKKAGRIYRITLNALDFNSNVSLAVAPALKNDFPELEYVTQTYHYDEGMITAGNSRYNEKQLAFGDENFFKVFDYQWIAGIPADALSEPNSVVLTETLAKKYFAGTNALGKTISLNNRNDLKVTGIIRDLPANTHFPFVLVASWATIKDGFGNGLNEFFYIPSAYTYIVLPENYSSERLQSRMRSFISKNWGDHVAKEGILLLQPLLNIHFDQRYINNIVTPVGRETFWALGGIALFIIITACINFINLATAQAITRSKEVGVRKVLGAHRFQLIRQFMGETSLLVLLSVLIAIAMTLVTLPLAAKYLDVNIATAQLIEPSVLATIGGITLFMILLAGIYPAFVQSGFMPVKALKSKINSHSSQSLIFRRTLVVLQFAISQMLIVGTIIVASQMDFFKNQDLGFNKEAVLSFELPDRSKAEAIRAKLTKNPDIKNLSFSSGAPAYNSGYGAFTSKSLGFAKADVTEFKIVDENYMEMFELKLVAGEGINSRVKDINPSAVVNETLIRRIGLKDPSDAIGKVIEVGNQSLIIKGVVKDFQSESKHKMIRACILVNIPGAFSQVSVRIQSQNIHKTIVSIDKLWSASFPEYLFKYEFLDDHIASLYKQEAKMYKAFQLFSIIAIFIGCLGLYGLISFIALQKTREIGVRKVLGASVLSIANLFYKEYVKLAIISFLIASPLSYLIMNRWLQNFAYQITIGWWVFIIAAIVSLLIAGLTISYKSFNAALANPVKSLRGE